MHHPRGVLLQLHFSWKELAKAYPKVERLRERYWLCDKCFCHSRHYCRFCPDRLDTRVEFRMDTWVWDKRADGDVRALEEYCKCNNYNEEERRKVELVKPRKRLPVLITKLKLSHSSLIFIWTYLLFNELQLTIQRAIWVNPSILIIRRLLEMVTEDGEIAWNRASSYSHVTHDELELNIIENASIQYKLWWR